MLTTVGPVLSDGTPLSDLVNLRTREVSMRVLADPEIHKLELQKLFARTWLLLGHETEIPNNGDFMLRWMAQDQVIVSRAADGKVHVSLNVCPHRGMKVCTADSGNAKVQRCIYHGWAFRSDGSFIGSPVEKEQMHGNVFEKSELGLRKAKVQLYGGLIFANWDHEGLSFEDFLGPMKFYYDMLFCRTDGGLEILGPPQRFVVPANWKAPSEQSAADGYHTLMLHRSMFEMGSYGSDGTNAETNAAVIYGVDISSQEGHAMRCGTGAKPADPALTLHEQLVARLPPGITEEMVPELERRFSEAQLRIYARGGPTVGGMFPNVLFLWINVPSPDGKAGGAMVLHTYMPRGPDHMEFTNWIFAERDTPEDMKRQMLTASVGAAGTSGTIEQDDAECWPHMSASARGEIGAQGTLKYGALLGVNKPDDWDGPARVYAGFSKDDTQWDWWQAWLAMMTK
jgi:phenylpropionate dioxygenase-like ring-hydroxylating dioxygenase large terminal subunit